MKEEFVTEELAIKLLAKGCPLDKVYISNEGRPFFYELPLGHPKWRNCDAWYIPTIAQVLGWLREVKGIDVLPQRGHINLDNNGKVIRYYNVNIYFERRFACTLDNDEQDYSTYEKAAIAGIEYVIDNLI